MVSVSDATTIIFDNLFRPEIRDVNVMDSTGRVLAETITADRDLPPFNRVSMDGIAIAYSQWVKGKRTFPIMAVQAAGEEPNKLSDDSLCFEVMTGAVLPAGCDTVVRYEDVEIKDSVATVMRDAVGQWQSVHVQGADARKDEKLLEPGQRLAPSEVALLSSVGKSMVRVFSYPRIAIVSTGDELIDIRDTPLPWQIRRSNSYALQSAVREMGGDATCFHLQDEKAAMTKSLHKILDDYDVLILSGGVSKGKFDFVPQVLEGIGIRKLFHQVSQRPGKPFWFGASGEGKVAFALPGNPVSTFMCFYRYVKPWIFKSLGTEYDHLSAILERDYLFAPPLTCFLQVTARNESGRVVARPFPGGGSGDFANLKNVTGFLELPLEKNEFKAGEVFPYISFRQ